MIIMFLIYVIKKVIVELNKLVVLALFLNLNILYHFYYCQIRVFMIGM